MSLLPENVLVVYNESDDGSSLEFARYYADIHGIAEDQFLGVAWTLGNSPSYADFKTYIEDPIFDRLIDEYSSVKCVVLAYGLPNRFVFEDDHFSAVTRIMAIYFDIDDAVPNPLFNRATYKDYDASDAAQVVVCSQFSSPTLVSAKAQVDSCKSVARIGVASGKFFFDKVTTPDSLDADGEAYAGELDLFEDAILPILNMRIFRTVPDNVQDVPLFRMKDDSFTWTWELSNSGFSYFQETKYPRIFFYNATTDAVSTLDEDDRTLSALAVQSGYACAAASCGIVETRSLLHPKPFFESLLRGATLGEAFTFALPNLNSTITFLGDPLIKVRFPIGEAISNAVTEVGAFEEMADEFASSIAFADQARTALRDVADIILNSTDVDTKGELTLLSARMAGEALGTSLLGYGAVAHAFINFPLTDVNQFLSDNELTVSKLINDVAQTAAISADNITEAGAWLFDAPIVASTEGFVYYHFEIEFADNPEFSDPFLIVLSEDDQTGLYYEKTLDSFVAIPALGVSSNYAGRRIRYVPVDTMTPGTVYHVRIRQKSSLSSYTGWVSFMRIVNT